MKVQWQYPVLAHSGEFHGRPADPVETSDPDSSNTDNSALELETLAPSTETTTIEVTEVNASAPPIAGVPGGLGESLFTILIGFPWLLLVLRTQLHPQTRP